MPLRNVKNWVNYVAKTSLNAPKTKVMRGNVPNELLKKVHETPKIMQRFGQRSQYKVMLRIIVDTAIKNVGLNKELKASELRELGRHGILLIGKSGHSRSARFDKAGIQREFDGIIKIIGREKAEPFFKEVSGLSKVLGSKFGLLVADGK